MLEAPSWRDYSARCTKLVLRLTLDWRRRCLLDQPNLVQYSSILQGQSALVIILFDTLDDGSYPIPHCTRSCRRSAQRVPPDDSLRRRDRPQADFDAGSPCRNRSCSRTTLSSSDLIARSDTDFYVLLLLALRGQSRIEENDIDKFYSIKRNFGGRETNLETRLRAKSLQLLLSFSLNLLLIDNTIKIKKKKVFRK